MTVQAGRVKHRVPTFGFVITENARPGKLNVNKLKELGVQPGPLYSSIKKGGTVTLPSGKLVSLPSLQFSLFLYFVFHKIF